MYKKINCIPGRNYTNSFYLNYNGNSYYLFTQPFHKGVNSFFKEGVSISNSLNRKLAKGDKHIMKTMDKMTAYIKYAEKYYGIKVLLSSEDRYKRSSEYKSMLKGLNGGRR